MKNRTKSKPKVYSYMNEERQNPVKMIVDIGIYTNPDCLKGKRGKRSKTHVFESYNVGKGLDSLIIEMEGKSLKLPKRFEKFRTTYAGNSHTSISIPIDLIYWLEIIVESKRD